MGGEKFKFKVIHIPEKPDDEKFERLDKLAHQILLEMRKGKTRDVVAYDRQGIQGLTQVSSVAEGKPCLIVTD